MEILKYFTSYYCWKLEMCVNFCKKKQTTKKTNKQNLEFLRHRYELTDVVNSSESRPPPPPETTLRGVICLQGWNLRDVAVTSWWRWIKRPHFDPQWPQLILPTRWLPRQEEDFDGLPLQSAETGASEARFSLPVVTAVSAERRVSAD